MRFSRLKQFSIVTLSMVLIIIGLVLWFITRQFSYENALITNRLEAEAIRIERTLSDTLDHTGFIMQMLLAQIKPKHQDQEHINGLLSSFRTEPSLRNILSWTVFSWADASHHITVDAQYGIMDEPFNLSLRDYIPYTKTQPGILHVGKPVFGSTSRKWMIPAGVGAVDSSGQYIGAITIGFDLERIIESIKTHLNSKHLDFALIDSDLNVILRSNAFIEALGIGENQIPVGDLRTALVNLLKQPELSMHSASVSPFGVEENYILYKMHDFPYVIFARYNKRYINQSFWQNFSKRYIEIGIILLAATLILLFIYKREIQLRRRTEQAHQEALRASKAKSDFLAYTSHELRNPLHRIILCSEMIKNQIFGKNSPKYSEYATDIHQNGSDLLEFINDILDDTRVEEGSFTLNEEEASLENIFYDVIRKYQYQAQQQNIQINQQVAANVPKLWLDKRRIRQIIANILSNSIKYSPKNSEINLSAYMIDGDIEVSLEDHGFGIREKDIEKVLTPYGTAKNQHSGKVESIGLGLPLAKKLAELHDATFTIRSSVGKGTTILVRFPHTRIYLKGEESFRKAS